VGMKKWKPVFVENSAVPKVLSRLAPIDIWAISFCGMVFCRGSLSPRVKRHETIHFQQQLEMLFVAQLVLYVAFWLFGLIKYRDGSVAYHENPFEREAYENAGDEKYLENRPRFAWTKYIQGD
jgi:hypothetical protein